MIYYELSVATRSSNSLVRENRIFVKSNDSHIFCQPFETSPGDAAEYSFRAGRNSELLQGREFSPGLGL